MSARLLRLACDGRKLAKVSLLCVDSDMEDSNIRVKIQNTNRDNVDVVISFVDNEDQRLQILLQHLKLNPRKSDDSTFRSGGITTQSSLSSTYTNDILLSPGSLSTGSVIVYAW